MQAKTKASMKVQVTLDQHEANHLRELSTRRGMSASDLIAGAIQNFITREPNEPDEARDWSSMSLAAFEKEWNNDEDAIYDTWRESYAVQQR